jgi:2-oxoglutarate dehydrogenase E1 component
MKIDKSEKSIIESFGWNSGYIEEMYDQYLNDPNSVSRSWREFFENLGNHENGIEDSTADAAEEVTKVQPIDGVVRPPVPSAAPIELDDDDELIPIRGAGAKILENMEASLTVPTATSQRTIPMKVMEENRQLINAALSARHASKISFTHIIAWAIIKAMKDHPVMNSSLVSSNGTVHRLQKGAVNLGLAVDVERKDGSRSLIVPNVKKSDDMNFREFVAAYDDIIARTRKGNIDPADFQGTTITLTNPGTVGTVASLPRLMAGQGAIIASGAIQYPAEYHGMSNEALTTLGLSKVMNITCTYDHRIIQGAESGQFLARVHELLSGKDEFYEDIFQSLNILHRPLSWSTDYNPALFDSRQNREAIEKQARVLQLINLYRVRGHLVADIDPLGERRQYHSELDPANHGFTIWDLDREFITGGLGGPDSLPLREILDILKRTYCGKIGIEYMHIQHPEEKTWLQRRIESTHAYASLDDDTRRHILMHLTNAEVFEKFMHTKFIGHKRFSVEGAEVTLASLANLLNCAAHFEVQEAVIGMAHRGRMNVLVNILKKSYASVFAAFEGNIDPNSVQGSGDVKYHLGATGNFSTKSGRTIKVSVVPNPSHLEAVNPVVEGIVRAKQERAADTERGRIIPVLIHGDAAFAGQGVVAETLNLSQLKGYRTGGTVHIIINNQIGFTATPEETRSSPYATDVAKMVQAPIFHVNGDDPDAAVLVTQIAIEYRQQFKKDVVVDIVCYRRHGHNEGDEPSYTQPLMYKKINEHPSVLAIYRDELIRDKVVSGDEAAAMEKSVRKCLNDSFEEAMKSDLYFKPEVPLAISEEEVSKSQPTGGGTGVSREALDRVVDALTNFPAGFKVHPKLAPLFEKRQKLWYDGDKVDWAFAEALAFGSLLSEGTPVRLSGQDSSRGTFSQRHSVLVDLNSGHEYVPLNNITSDQAHIQVYDSLLSEEAVLGFEFGYTVADPLTLVCWEAQFGDFANGAQIIIDNFIASSEAKWQQPCDLVLLLPHGHEGQGPEHSSARLERFLVLCAENNWQVCNCSTPAQYFHVLRRQMRDADRLPLVLMTPKSLLRHPRVISRRADFTEGRFHEVIDDDTVADRDAVTRMLLCSGKVYYELLDFREKNQISDVAILRLEQFYPYPKDAVQSLLKNYAKAKDIVWVQEEPQNMGAWNFLRYRLTDALQKNQSLSYAGRPESASPAAGTLKQHKEGQAKLVEEAFGK